MKIDYCFNEITFHNYFQEKFCPWKDSFIEDNRTASTRRLKKNSNKYRYCSMKINRLSNFNQLKIETESYGDSHGTKSYEDFRVVLSA